MMIPGPRFAILAACFGLAVMGQSAPPGVAGAAGAGDLPPLDVSDPYGNAAGRQLDAMSADQVARYLTEPKTAEFSWAFYVLTRKGEAAIPHLVGLMGRDDLGFGWTRVPLALIGIGDQSLPALVNLLKSDNPTARRNAAWALMKREKPARDAIGSLIEVIRGNDEVAAGYAALALIPNGKDAAAAVPDLIALAFLITEKNDAACMAIEAIGLDPKYIPEVIAQMTIADHEPRASSLRVYVGTRLLAAADRHAAEALAESLGHENLQVRLAAVQVIGKFGPQARTQVVEDALNRVLVDDALRAEAAAALVAIGASARAAVPALIKDLENGAFIAPTPTINRQIVPNEPDRHIVRNEPDYRYVCRAADVLGTIPEARPALLEGLSSDNEMVRIGCAWALMKQVGPAELELKLTGMPK